MSKGFNCSGTSVCVNEVGGYYCSCPTGFRLSSSQGCEGKGERRGEGAKEEEMREKKKVLEG